eukprot:m.297262 g.297262  ORF g.297262 m.297262 type:complete len:102 (+) comp27199_c0_seq7:849-1154(+)
MRRKYRHGPLPRPQIDRELHRPQKRRLLARLFIRISDGKIGIPKLGPEDFHAHMMTSPLCPPLQARTCCVFLYLLLQFLAHVKKHANECHAPNAIITAQAL